MVPLQALPASGIVGILLVALPALFILSILKDLVFPDELETSQSDGGYVGGSGYGSAEEGTGGGHTHGGEGSDAGRNGGV